MADSQTPEAESRPLPVCPPPPPDIHPPPGVIEWGGDKPKSGRKHVIIAGEAVAAVQADSYLVRASEEGIGWVEDILAQYPRYRDHFWAENQTMIDLREKHGDIIHMIAQHRLNSFDYSLFYSASPFYKRGLDCYGNRGQWEPGDFLIHWPGVPLEKRMELLDKYEPQIVI